jgi:hypothetical protein
MSRLEDHIITTIKPFINKGDVDPLKELWREYRDHTEFPREVAWDYVFQKIYIHAALQQQQAICDWLDEIFLDFDPIIQIGMRHTFAYARTLLKKKDN